MAQRTTRRGAIRAGAGALAGIALGAKLDSSRAQNTRRRAPLKTAVLIHGAGGGGWEYDKWRPVLSAAGFRVVAPDLVPAPGGLAATTLDDYMQQVVTWARRDGQKGGRTVLIGASMGGILALKAAETLAPAAIVLVNSVAPRGVGPEREVKTHPPIVRWANGPLQETRDSMPDSDEATIQWAWKKWRDESGAVMSTLSGGVEVRLPRCPALAVLGEEDTDIPAATGLALARWASADTMLFHNMSHVGPLLSTRASEVAQQVAFWLSRRPGLAN